MGRHKICQVRHHLQQSLHSSSRPAPTGEERFGLSLTTLAIQREDVRAKLRMSMRSLVFGHDQHQFCLADEILPNKRFRIHLANAKALVELLDFDAHHERVTRNHWLPPPQALNTPKEELACTHGDSQCLCNGVARGQWSERRRSLRGCAHDHLHVGNHALRPLVILEAIDVQTGITGMYCVKVAAGFRMAASRGLPLKRASHDRKHPPSKFDHP